MNEQGNTRAGIASRLRGHATGPIVALVLGLSTASLAPAQSGPAVPVLRIGGSSGRVEALRPLTGSKADAVPGAESHSAGNDQAKPDSQLLLSLLREEATLLQNFGADHPQVQSVRERIRLARGTVARKPIPPTTAPGEDDPPAARPALPEVIALTGASGRETRGSVEPRPLPSAVAGATGDAGIPPVPQPAAPPARVPDKPGPTGTVGLILQGIGLAVVYSFGLAASILLVCLLYRRAGVGFPLIQVHLVKTPKGGGDTPGDSRPPPAGRQGHSATPAQAGPAEATPDETPESGEDAIVKQVLAMNLQLKAELMEAEAGGGEPAPFGPARVAAPAARDSTKDQARGE